MHNQNRILRVFKLITLLKTFPAKTIKRLSQSLEISERSCYRYMDLLTELGFEVGKDDHNKFFLKADQIVEPFTKEESHLIQEVLTVSVKNNPLVASIKAKLPSLEESNILANNIVNGHLSKLVSQINESILNKTQINIIKYQSASSESITDRLVEPIGFTSNYQYLCAFEVESKQNKYFKLVSMLVIYLGLMGFILKAFKPKTTEKMIIVYSVCFWIALMAFSIAVVNPYDENSVEYMLKDKVIKKIKEITNEKSETMDLKPSVPELPPSETMDSKTSAPNPIKIPESNSTNEEKGFLGNAIKSFF